LFNPKKNRFGFQGAIPKNQARLAKSLGRTVGEKLVTAGDLQGELARPELQQAFESRLRELIADIIASRDPLIDKVPPAVITALEGVLSSYLPDAMAPMIWEWIHMQLPSLVKRLDLQGMVERKVMAFSVDRVEEILRSVIQNELNMIIVTGYVLGGLIGMVTFGLSKLIGL